MSLASSPLARADQHAELEEFSTSQPPRETLDAADLIRDDDSQVERDRDEPAYLPTPEEIAAACAEIRAGWSLNERCRRGIGPRRNF